MNYITLTPDAFVNEDGYTSFDYLSQYCQVPTTNKFIYYGVIDCTHHSELIYPNIVKCYTILSQNITKNFPDLEEAKIFYYYKVEIPDIGKLKSVDIFNLNLKYASGALSFIKKYIKIIDKNTLIINGKELKVGEYWEISNINKYNYINYEL